MRLNKFVPLIIAMSIGAAFPVSASAAECEPQGSRHGGIYELQDVMEVGSVIWLGNNGRFEYMLAYGAVDEYAEGCWTKSGGEIVLAAKEMKVSRGGNKFSKLRLKVRSGSRLIRSFGGGQKGTYKRVRR